MTVYSATALRHVDALVAHYRAKKRPEAVRNLLAVLRRAETTINGGAPRARTFPATFHGLVRPGRAWIKESPYWIAFERRSPPVIVAVYWEGADIAGRYPLDP